VPLTIQATGLGAAGAAIITDELCRLGLRTFVRVGTARALPLADGTTTAAGTAVAVTGALAADGPSRTLGAGRTVLPDPALAEGLAGPGVLAGLVASADLPHPAPADVAAWVAAGALATDLQTAAVLQVALTHDVPAAAILVITGPVGELAPDLDEEAHLSAVKGAAHAAAHALGIPPRDGRPLPPPRDDERAGA
jgi:uridine phosphorylase